MCIRDSRGRNETSGMLDSVHLASMPSISRQPNCDLTRAAAVRASSARQGTSIPEDDRWWIPDADWIGRNLARQAAEADGLRSGQEPEAVPDHPGVGDRRELPDRHAHVRHIY